MAMMRATMPSIRSVLLSLAGGMGAGDGGGPPGHRPDGLHPDDHRRIHKLLLGDHGAADGHDGGDDAVDALG